MNPQWSTLVASLSFLLPLIGCGQHEDQSALRESARIYRQPTVVVMGGNESCRVNQQQNEYEPRHIAMYPSLTQIITKLKDELNVPSRVIATCYDSSATIYYAVDDEPEVRVGDRASLLQDLLEAVHDNSLLALIGHSYGGWLSMKLSDDLAKDERQIAGLYTVDPISRVDCSFSNPFGCQSAPRDVKKSEREAIKEQSEVWANFYQTETFYLHSSEIDEADSNHHIETSHSRIQVHETLWNEVELSLRRLL
jgi:pimeloyl-ACP methyl ester carboxylesterase